jgi:hypothetical protein
MVKLYKLFLNEECQDKSIMTFLFINIQRYLNIAQKHFLLKKQSFESISFLHEKQSVLLSLIILLVLQQKIDHKVLFFSKMTLSSLYKKFWASKNYQACILNFTAFSQGST